MDGLNGFKDAIGAVYPFAKIQRCIIHQLRSSMKYIPYKDKKAFAKDLKAVYGASSRKWTRSYENWDMVVNQLNILFSEILNKGA